MDKSKHLGEMTYTLNMTVSGQECIAAAAEGLRELKEAVVLLKEAIAELKTECGELSIDLIEGGEGYVRGMLRDYESIGK